MYPGLHVHVKSFLTFSFAFAFLFNQPATNGSPSVKSKFRFVCLHLGPPHSTQSASTTVTITLL